MITRRTERMTYRERYTATLAHQPVDRCPIDLGGTPQSTVDEPALITALATLLGVAGEPDDYDKFDSRVLAAFDIDFRRVGDIIRFATGREHRVSATEYVDFFGIRHRFDGRYWNIVDGPLRDATLDDVAAYAFPTMAQCRTDIDRFAMQARHWHDASPYVVVAEHPVFGVLELACWLCGYDDFMMRLAAEPEFVHLLFGKILAFQREVSAAYYTRVGRWIHVTTSGDDFGTQAGLFMAPATWRACVKPYLAARIADIARHTDAIFQHHSCGGIAEIIPDLIEIGVGVLNPIQPHARGMDPAALQAAFGDRIVFHGGLDTQQVLPGNDPVEIEAAVAHLLQVMRPRERGGYIFAAAHNLQADVAPEAVACMFRAALDA
jgi:uroporphyrinogen decarboxylase